MLDRMVLTHFALTFGHCRMYSSMIWAWQNCFAQKLLSLISNRLLKIISKTSMNMCFSWFFSLVQINSFFKLFESSMVTLIFFLNGSSTSILTLFEEVNFMKGKPSKETHGKNSTNQKRKLCFPFLMTAKKNRYFFRFSKLLRSKAHNGIVEAILIFAFCESWKSRRSSLFSSDANKESLDWLMVRRN